MQSLEIQCNGVGLAVIGAGNALMYSANISATISETAPTIDVRGMLDLGDERTSHVVWLNQAPLHLGDVLHFRFIEAETVTMPSEEIATDSSEYLAGMAEYEELVKSNPLVERQLEATNPEAALQLRMGKDTSVIARLESEREFITMLFVWNRWSPERCRISLRSFSQSEALARAAGKEWYRGKLGIGERCEVTVGA